ncbi:MAG: c-type cytochrome biogenesis protein CcsB [Thermodesulfobacteriota bacterium]
MMDSHISSFVLSMTTFVYALSSCLYIAAWVFKKDPPGKLAMGTLMLAAAGNAAGIVLRWIESYDLGIGHAPFSNLYESLVFYSLVIAILSLVMEFRYRNRVIGAFTTPLMFLALAYASLNPNMNDRIQPLIPALKSNWLIAHVITCFLGYAGFAVAFVVSLMYLLKSRNLEESDQKPVHLPAPAVLDDITHQLVMFGFFFLSIGIITGAVWANSAWGRYWGWDPKETWSLVTWFIYAVLLHARFMRGWQGKRIALLSIVGFSAVIFTYFGVNYLPGLHSYGQMP